MSTRARASLSIVISALLFSPSAAFAVLMGVYEFDGGGDGTSWEDASNWEQVLDPDGNPISGNPATPPSAVTSAEIPLLGVTVSGAGQTALDVRIGTASGAGSLDIGGGGQHTVRDMIVGSGVNAGALSVSGGTLAAGDDITAGDGSIGTISVTSGQVSTGDDFNINAGSRLDMAGGTISIGDRLTLNDDGVIDLIGGTITVADDMLVFDSAQTTVSDGLLEVADKITLDDPLNPQLIIDGRIVRSEEFGDGTDPLGVVEINGAGAYQIALLTVAEAIALIDAGDHFVSSSGMLTAFTVSVPSFFGALDVQFTQISVMSGQRVPEPGSIALMVAGLLGAGFARRSRNRSAGS